MSLLTYVSKIQGGDVGRAFKRTAFWRAVRHRLQDFDPLLREVPPARGNPGDVAGGRPWEALIQELQALIVRLTNNSSDSAELLDRIEDTVQALRLAAAERHRQWVEAFFKQLRGRCSEKSDLKAMVPDIDRLELTCARSELTPTQLIDRLVAIGNVVETGLVKYATIAEGIQEKEAQLARLSSSIAAASLHERPALRRAETVCREELSILRESLFDLESVLSAALENGVNELPAINQADPAYPRATATLEEGAVPALGAGPAVRPSPESVLPVGTGRPTVGQVAQ